MVANVIVVFAVAIVLASCDQRAASGQPGSSASTGESAGLKERLDALEIANRLLKEKVEFVEGLAFNAESRNSFALLSSDETAGYAVGKNQHGLFLVTLGKIEPYLDGHKINLNIGHTSFAVYAGAKIKLEYGPTYIGNFQNVETTVTPEFLPGRYTPVTLTVMPSQPKDLRVMRVSVTFDQLRLGQF